MSDDADSGDAGRFGGPEPEGEVGRFGAPEEGGDVGRFGAPDPEATGATPSGVWARLVRVVRRLVGRS